MRKPRGWPRGDGGTARPHSSRARFRPTSRMGGGRSEAAMASPRRRLEGEHALRKAYAEDRLARLEGAVRALARRVKALEVALNAQVQAQAEDRAQDRARRLEVARAELEDLAPRVFAKRGGDVDVLVAADHLRALLAQGRLEEVEPTLARWRAEVG
jgi:aminopeptidase N